MKMLKEGNDTRSFVGSFGKFLKGLFLEFTSWIRKGLSLGVMLFLAFTTLSFLNRGVGYLEGSLEKPVIAKQPEAVAPPVSRGNVNVSRAVVDPVSRYVAQPVVVRETYSPRSTRDALRDTGYLVNELESFTRTLARFGR